jgi:ceramide synthetase
MHFTEFPVFLSVIQYTILFSFGMSFFSISVWSVGMSVPSDIYYLYCIQTSFYIHSIYATVFMDTWRKDSIAMLIHHVLTVFLLCFSFAVR